MECARNLDHPIAKSRSHSFRNHRREWTQQLKAYVAGLVAERIGIVAACALTFIDQVYPSRLQANTSEQALALTFSGYWMPGLATSEWKKSIDEVCPQWGLARVKTGCWWRLESGARGDATRYQRASGRARDAWRAVGGIFVGAKHGSRAGKARLLFELDTALQNVGSAAAEHPSVVKIAGVYHNLLRLWSDAAKSI
jgi:hypothetical protein